MSSAAVIHHGLRALNPRRRTWSVRLGLDNPWPWLLAGGVLLSRILTTGPVYFADGPAEIRAINTGAFVIQPPGYWLFLRMASLFPDPAFAISIMNWTFSAAGAVVFYWAARLLVGEGLAKLGSAAYAVAFYAWFSGTTHSTYASQLLFPVLVFLLLVMHAREQRVGYLIAASVAFGLGAGLRPSDGAFIGIMFVFYLIRHAPFRQAIIAFGVATLVCLGWLAPTVVCYSMTGQVAWAGHYIVHITTVVSVLANGLSFRAIANMSRFAVPLAISFGPLLFLALKGFRRVRGPAPTLLRLWIVPGAVFLVFCYMSDAPYLNFLTAPVLLLALMEIEHLSCAWQRAFLLPCVAWNIAFFIFFQPVLISSFPFAVADIYAGKYTRYGVVHHWQPNLSTLENGDGFGIGDPVQRPSFQSGGGDGN